MKPPGQTTLVIDCRDLDKFIEEHVGKPWDTLASERENELHNGKMTVYEAFATEENTAKVEAWLTKPSLAKWHGLGEWDQEQISTDDLLSYLVGKGILDEDDYTVHLWW